MIKVLVVGQTPPPHGGQAAMIERLVNSKLPGLQLIHVRMGFSSHMNEVGKVRVSKILHMFSVIARIIYHRFADGAKILYYPPAGPDRVPVFRDLIILLATRWLFKKTVFHLHAGGGSTLYDRMPAWQRWFFRRAYFGADAVIRLSELTPEDGKRLKAKHEYVIPYGIDDPCPGLTVSESAPFNVQDTQLRILFVGVLRESKGLLVLIEACGMLAARGVPFQLEIMGQWQSDEIKARANRRIEELNLSTHLRFLGLQVGEEKFRAFRRANVFCFPSFFNSEAFPVVLLEALACGLPVVSTRWRGIPSIVDEDECGLLVEPHDEQAVADALASLAADPGLRTQMGAASRERFEREFIVSTHLRRMSGVFLDVAGVSHAEKEVPVADALVPL
jgi:glycosyltransferase involved in cell wall biosynthesis